ncbi:MAG: sugar phosphate isomerase/epimerase family protein, partial [Geminicoccaceae bacterium]
MKTGFNLLLWTTHVTDEHLPLLGKLKAAGYDGVEVPVFEGEVAHFRRLGQAIKDCGLACTTVTVLPDAEHSAIHPDPKSRQGAVEHLAWTIECSQALGSELLCGPFHQELAVFSGAGPTPDEIA